MAIADTLAKLADVYWGVNAVDDEEWQGRIKSFDIHRTQRRRTFKDRRLLEAA
jgi:hypothetical protein